MLEPGCYCIFCVLCENDVVLMVAAEFDDCVVFKGKTGLS